MATTQHGGSTEIWTRITGFRVLSTTGCFKFKYIHERESYEVLLAILKKRKKVYFAGGPANKIKRPRPQSPKLDAVAKYDSEEIPVIQKVPRAKEVPFNMSQESQYSFPLIADTANSTSIAALPNDY